MNRLLASSLNALNGLIALLIVFGGAFAGLYGTDGSSMGLILGAVGGFLVAVLACGVIAYLAQIDAFAEAHGFTRSGFIAKATKRAMDLEVA